MEKIVKFVILACLLACSEPKIEHKKCHEMNTSHALPIEFWDIDDETYNEKEVCGITPVCFCQPRNCGDDITLSLPSESFDYGGDDNDYSLLIRDSNGDDLDIEPFIKESEEVGPDLTFTATNYNPDGDQTWNTSTKFTQLTNTNLLSGYIIFPIVDGLANRELRMQVDYQLVRSAGVASNMIPTYTIWNADKSESLSVTGATSTTTNLWHDDPIFNPTFVPAYFGIKFEYVYVSSGALASITILNGTDTKLNWYYYKTNRYNLSVNPQDLSICNQQVRFYIVNDDSPNTPIKKSDCISLKTSHPCTTLIEYSNSTDFDGADNLFSSPITSYNLLIPGIFFEESNTKESEDIELSNDEIVRLYDKIEEKRELQIGFMPHYMHRKLLLALAFDFVVIDGKEWIARDEYKKIEGNRHYPLRRASILLTDKNFIKENQL